MLTHVKPVRVIESEHFIDALERRDLQALRRCAKADLHTHGYLAANRDFVRLRTGTDIEPLTAPLASMDEMHAYVDAHVRPQFQGRAGRLFGFEAAFVQATHDGVTRLELGDDVWAITRGMGDAVELHRSLARIHAATAPDVEWIAQASLSRHVAIDLLQAWLEPFLSCALYDSLDLSGDEFAQPIERFVPLYRKAKSAGLTLKAHVGEWGTADDVWRAVEVLELDEVQHGIAAAGDPHVMRFLADHRIRLNICPTSNRLLGRVQSLATHPMRTLFDAGVVVTVNTDDVLVFGNGVSEEFLALFDAGLLRAAELDLIRLNGLRDFRPTGRAGKDTCAS